MMAKLSDRERECLERAASGQSDKQIGLDLGLSDRTVSNHLAKAYRKLGVRGRLAAAHALGRIAHPQNPALDHAPGTRADRKAEADQSPPLARSERRPLALPALPESVGKRALLVLVFLVLGAIFSAGVVTIASINLIVAGEAAPANAR